MPPRFAKVGRALRNAGALVLGLLGALSAFGLLLALAWIPHFGAGTPYKIASLLVVTGLSTVVGGYLATLFSGRNRALGIALGAFVGLFAFGYVLGPDWRVLLAVPACALLGYLGGALSRLRIRPSISRHG